MIIKLLLKIFTYIVLLLPFALNAQTGGDYDFKFLTLTNSARIAALGSNWLPVKDGDLNNTLMNPSLITKEMHNSLALNYINDVGGINYGYAMYSRHFEKVGSFTTSFQFINYGDMIEADETGATLGDFSANELAFNVGWGRELSPRWSIGANFKLAYSGMYAGYHAFGLGVDVSGSYFIPDENLTLSLVANNIGYVIDPYSAGEGGAFPISLSFGVSQKLKHIPFRYVLIYDHIEKWDLRGNSIPTTTTDPITGETSTKSGIDRFGDNFMRHIVIGGEITIAKVFNLRAGYNYGRRQEMKEDTRKAMTGFSWGAGLKFSRFSIDYGRPMYHLAGSPNYFTFTANLDKLFGKRTREPKSAL